MAKILFLAHRVPFPPNKGDKIRAFHILKHLAQSHEIYLGTLADEADDFAVADWLEASCADVCIARRGRVSSALRMGQAFLTGAPMSVGAFRNRTLSAWCASTLDRAKPDLIFVFSSAMAHYAQTKKSRGLPVILDFVDVDSEKFRQYAQTGRWPLSIVYRTEAASLLAFDRAAAEEAFASLFVSQSELDLFQRRTALGPKKLHTVPNGVDATYFAPTANADATPPYPPTIIFTGRMDYPPNIDAVEWFAHDIFPFVRKSHPEAIFKIVGAQPHPKVEALGNEPNVHVTGRVADVRPFYSQASLVVAPMRIARGIQNKVLEAMAMAKPVVVTPAALEGIDAKDGSHVLIGETETDIAARVCDVLQTHVDRDIGSRARQHVINNFDWAAQLRALDDLVAAAINGSGPHTPPKHRH